MRRALIGLVAVACLAPTPAAAQHFRDRVAFPEILRGHLREAIGWARLPATDPGDALDQPAIVVTATASGVEVHGETVLPLSAGRADPAALRTCRGEVVCAPALRDAIAEARAALAAALEIPPPPVLLAVPVDLPYPTLLLVARSAAEAGAALSLAVIARSEGDSLVGIPILVAPGREIVLGRAQEPALISLGVDGSRVAIRATAGYLAAPTLAADPDDLDDILGRLALTSGRTTCLVTATVTTLSCDVLAAARVARRSFPRLILTDPGGIRVIGR